MPHQSLNFYVPGKIQCSSFLSEGPDHTIRCQVIYKHVSLLRFVSKVMKHINDNL